MKSIFNYAEVQVPTDYKLKRIEFWICDKAGSLASALQVFNVSGVNLFTSVCLCLH